MKRLYEWRWSDNGERYGKPVLAEDACDFFRSQRLVMRGGWSPSSDEDLKRTSTRGLNVYVSSTGEYVQLIMEAGTAKLMSHSP